ncbi:MAG TPA: polysaccharide pyruvyl transferase family protein [Stenotrophomonas sp.]|nr:polysaccharide pyruvyl transferase family protein [Stenotrophomonas sp.]
MKIGVLTFHRCINYGSYWQARCLVDGLRALGHEAVLLDHASRRIDVAEWKCALQPTLPVPVLPADRARYRRKMLRFFAGFHALPLSPRFPIDTPAQMPACDAVVVGSDEVWNLSHPWYGHWPLFYGEGLRARRVVSYAASFGHYDARRGLERTWAQRLRRFDAIAVRDTASRLLVKEAVGVAPQMVLDPCLAFPAPSIRQRRYAGTRYLALYGHGFSPGFSAAVQQWAQRHGLPVVSIGYHNDWADEQWIDAGPLDFPGFIAGAQAVASNFFHGCVFALRHDRPFICEGSHYRSTKLRSLMAQAGTPERLFEQAPPSGAVDSLLGVPLPAEVQARLQRARERSHRYLHDALAPASAAA